VAITETSTESLKEDVHRKDKYESKATSIIKKYSLITGAVCLIPYRGVDMVSSSVIQTLMVRELCRLYKIEYSDRLINVGVWSVAGSLLIKLVTELIHNIIPTTKSDLKIDLTGAAIGAIYTATLGEFYRLHFHNGGVLEDVSALDFVDYFVAEVQRGNLSIDSFTNPRKLINQFVLS
jgi:uncharacterized protein (DUF697 family)